MAVCVRCVLEKQLWNINFQSMEIDCACKYIRCHIFRLCVGLHFFEIERTGDGALYCAEFSIIFSASSFFLLHMWNGMAESYMISSILSLFHSTIESGKVTLVFFAFARRPIQCHTLRPFDMSIFVIFLCLYVKTFFLMNATKFGPTNGNELGEK